MTNNNHFAYYEDEASELESIQDLQKEAELKFNVDWQKAKNGDPVELSKLGVNAGSKIAEFAVPGYGATKNMAENVRRAGQMGDLYNSDWEAIISIVNGDELRATVESPRLYFFEKVSKAFSWFGDAIIGLFSAIIPFGDDVKRVVSEGETVTGIAGGLSSTYLNKEDIAELFHLEDEAAIQAATKVLDQNKDGRVDRLELETGQELLNMNQEVVVEEKERRGMGTLIGGNIHLALYHQDSIDENEYTERYGKLNLLRTLGNSSAQVIGERFNELDMDNDGQVSRSEFRMALAGLDKDNNHRVTREEAGAYQDDANSAFDAMIAHQQQNGR